jgi:hypothetical protein
MATQFHHQQTNEAVQFVHASYGLNTAVGFCDSGAISQ